MKEWYALYTKPFQERTVEAWLRGHGAETYLPLVRRRTRRRDRPEDKVYFPCYLFARLDLEAMPRSSIAWMPGVRGIVSAGERPIVVSDEAVRLIRRRLEQIEEIGYSDFAQGDRVRIVCGPLRDLEAVFDRPLSASDRVRILLDVLGRMTPAVVDVEQIVKA